MHLQTQAAFCDKMEVADYKRMHEGVISRNKRLLSLEEIIPSSVSHTGTNALQRGGADDYVGLHFDGHVT